MPVFISQMLSGDASSLPILVGAIIVCALCLEDVTTFIVGVLVADGIIPATIAIPALYIGIMLGDAMWYSIGAFARTHARLARYIDHDFTAPFRSWLLHRYEFKIFSGHFVPGLRSTTYIASGFFGVPIRSFAPPAIAGGLTLEILLFTIAYLFGSLTTTWIGPLRWGLAAVFLIVLFFLARHNILSYRAERAARATTPEEAVALDSTKR